MGDRPPLEASPGKASSQPAALSLRAAAAAARQAGITPLILADDIEGEARVIGAEHARLVRERPRDGAPLVLLSGGETSVTVRDPNSGGRGGRNQEYLLALAQGIAGLGGVEALAADTDGIDGTEANAGAFADGQTMARLSAMGLDSAMLLDRNDAYAAFAALGDLLVTGPTRTNVNDFRAILIG